MASGRESTSETDCCVLVCQHLHFTHNVSLWVLLPRRELIQNPGGVRGKDASRHVKEASVRIRQAGHGLSFKDTPSWTWIEF